MPKFPKKYKGNVHNIVFRSMLERKVMGYLDKNPNIISWSSEEIVIPYISPIDGKKHRYFPDFLIEIRTKDNIIQKLLIEVKPQKFCQPPKQTPTKVNTKRYINEVLEWGKNSAKWKAANSVCQKMGWTFKILTEKELT